MKSSLELDLNSFSNKIPDPGHKFNGKVGHFSSMRLNSIRQSTGYDKCVIHDVFYLVHIVVSNDVIQNTEKSINLIFLKRIKR